MVLPPAYGPGGGGGGPVEKADLPVEVAYEDEANVFTENQKLNSFLDLGEIVAPAAPGANVIRLFSFDENGKSRRQLKTPDGSVVTVTQDNNFIARNNSGATIDRGKAVFITGSLGNRPTIGLARSDADATMPCVGVAADDIPNNTDGRVTFSGIVDQIDTSAFTEGDRLFVSDSTAGALVVAEPAHPSLRQQVSVVNRQHASQGEILLLTLIIRGDHEGTNKNQWKVGSNTAGAKDLVFRNGFDQILRANPTAARTVTLPDLSGVLGIVGENVLSSVALQSFNVPGGNTYTPTAGMKRCLVIITGAGGGGGGADTAGGAGDVGVGAGGGAGGTAIGLFTAAQIGASQTVTIGTGGVAGADTGGNGGTGGASTFGALLTANGGGGGIGSGASAADSQSTAGGAGGTATGGIVNITGGDGGYSVGGSADGTIDLVFGVGGAGGGSFWGGGGRQTSRAQNSLTADLTLVGQPGTARGGGGSGGVDLTATAGVVGGSGAGGQCVILEFI